MLMLLLVLSAEGRHRRTTRRRGAGGRICTTRQVELRAYEACHMDRKRSVESSSYSNSSESNSSISNDNSSNRNSNSSFGDNHDLKAPETYGRMDAGRRCWDTDDGCHDEEIHRLANQLQNNTNMLNKTEHQTPSSSLITPNENQKFDIVAEQDFGQFRRRLRAKRASWGLLKLKGHQNDLIKRRVINNSLSNANFSTYNQIRLYCCIHYCSPEFYYGIC